MVDSRPNARMLDEREVMSRQRLASGSDTDADFELLSVRAMCSRVCMDLCFSTMIASFLGPQANNVTSGLAFGGQKRNGPRLAFLFSGLPAARSQLRSRASLFYLARWKSYTKRYFVRANAAFSCPFSPQAHEPSGGDSESERRRTGESPDFGMGPRRQVACASPVTVPERVPVSIEHWQSFMREDGSLPDPSSIKALSFANVCWGRRLVRNVRACA